MLTVLMKLLPKNITTNRFNFSVSDTLCVIVTSYGSVTYSFLPSLGTTSSFLLFPMLSFLSLPLSLLHPFPPPPFPHLFPPELGVN